MINERENFEILVFYNNKRIFFFKGKKKSVLNHFKYYVCVFAKSFIVTKSRMHVTMTYIYIYERINCALSNWNMTDIDLRVIKRWWSAFIFISIGISKANAYATKNKTHRRCVIIERAATMVTGVSSIWMKVKL